MVFKEIKLTIINTVHTERVQLYRMSYFYPQHFNSVFIYAYASYLLQTENSTGGYQNDSKSFGKSNKRKNGAAKLSVFPDKNITYMWCDINVFTSKAADSHKTSSKIGSIVNSINCFKSSKGGSRRKHILQNGEYISIKLNKNMRNFGDVRYDDVNGFFLKFFKKLTVFRKIYNITINFST